MIFVLVGIGLVLLYRKKFSSFFVALGTGLVIGTLYMLPLARYFGDPLLTVHSYTTRDYGGGGVVGPHGHLFGWPFHGIVAGTLAYPAPWTNLLLSFLWIGLVLAGVCMMFSSSFREYAKTLSQRSNFLRIVPSGSVLLRLSDLGSQQFHPLFNSGAALRFLCVIPLPPKRPQDSLVPEHIERGARHVFRSRS